VILSFVDVVSIFRQDEKSPLQIVLGFRVGFASSAELSIKL
jgi:hypothetical protein